MLFLEKKKLKILYIHHGIGIGGAPLSLLYLIQKMDRSKYYPMVLCIYDSEVVDIFRKEGIETYVAKNMTCFSHTTGASFSFINPYSYIEAFNYIPSVIKTYKWLKKLNADIVHLNSSCLTPQIIGAKLAGAKVVWHIREYIINGNFGLRKYFHTLIGKNFVDKIISISQTDAEQLNCLDKTKVIYNFVDFEKFNYKIDDNILRSTYNLDKSDKIILFLGGISKIKGTLEYIRAAKEIIKEKDNYYYFVLGGKINKKEKPEDIKSLIKNIIKKVLGMENYLDAVKKEINGFEDRIIFEGIRNDIPKYISGSNLLVFPSTVPHFARPIIEASAMKIPVIGSKFGEIEEAIVNDKTGILVPPSDVNALKNAILKICENPTLAKEMGEEGYKLAKERFDADKNTKETFKVYDELFNK